jgi:hypothetical protein
MSLAGGLGIDVPVTASEVVTVDVGVMATAR